MKKRVLLFVFLVFLSFASFSYKKQPKLSWKEGGPRYVTYATITGKTGFITTPSAFCAPMGTMMFGFEQTFSTKSPIGVMSHIFKWTFTPFYMFEFGFSKEIAFLDAPGSAIQPLNSTPVPLAPGEFYFDSTPFFWHFKLRLFNWGTGAIALGEDFEYVPDNSGAPSRGLSSTTIYAVFTGVTTVMGSFNFGFGKTFYFTRPPDALINFFASWVYSFAKLDDRLQLVLDFSNADYRAGANRFKVSDENRAYLNFQVRGVAVKTKIFQLTMMFALYDLLDISSNGFNASFGLTLNADLY